MISGIIIYLILSIACLALAGICTGVMDSITFHYSVTKYLPKGEEKLFGKGQQYWDEKIAWRNKYKNGDPKQGKAFFGSTTFLVRYTSGWHRMKGRQNDLIRLSTVFLMWPIIRTLLAFKLALLASVCIWILLFIAMSGGFWVTYTLLK